MNVTIRWPAYRPLGAELKRRAQQIQAARWAREFVGRHTPSFGRATGIASFTRVQKFSFGVALALWPLLIVALVPSDALVDRSSILCLSAVLSEAAASVLFFQLRRRHRDRLAFWSKIAVAVAGEVALAFLIAAAVIAAHAP